jgi:ubiquinone/menaquinone biosynthesis C-methylase UbiE
MTGEVRYGLGKGKVFPHQKAHSLLHPARRFIQSAHAVAAWIGLRGDETVLELGCGPGYFSPALRAGLPRGRLVLFDLQPEMLAIARGRVGTAADVPPVTGNAMALPFRAEAFDVVFIAAVLGEVPDRQACLREVRRTLRPGGKLVVNEVRGDADYISTAELDRACREAGLRPRRRRRGRLRWTCLTEYVRG